MAKVDEDLVCNWCGDLVCLETEYSCELSCGPRCGRRLYHQTCVEEHLRRAGVKMDRMTGYPCPRGLGKYQPDGDACRGKINSTHKKVPCKNKQKKQAAALLAPPKAAPPAQRPKPAPQPGAAAAAAARLTAHLAKLPTPVRGGVAPGTNAVAAAAAAAPATKAQYMEIAAQLRKELGVEGRYEAVPGKPGQATSAAAKPAAAAAAAAGPSKGKQARAEAAQIPGMEYVEPRRKPAKAAGASPVLKQQNFNLNEQTGAFPSLPGGGNHAAAARKSVEGGGKQINAMNPNHAFGFVTDLDRYNALIGAGESSGDDDAQLSTPHGAGSSSAGSTSLEPPPEDPAPDLSLISEDMMTELVQLAIDNGAERGVELAGLPESYVPLVQALIDLLPDDLKQSLRCDAHRARLSAEQQAEADRAAYLEAERVVLEGERSTQAVLQLQSAPFNPYGAANAGQVQMLAPVFVAPQPLSPMMFVAPAAPPFFEQRYSPAGMVAEMAAAQAPEEEDVDVDELLALCLA